MILGDSLSAAYGIGRDQGWVSLLAQRLHEQGYPHRVVNASISGDTSAGGLARLPAALQRHRPDVVVVELGANDGLQGMPPQLTTRNLQGIVQASRAAGAAVVLVGVTLPPNYGAAFRDRFAQMYAELAKTEGLPLAQFAIEEVAGQAGMIQDDGLHPTAAAQPLMLNAVWPALEPLLKRQRTE